ncbi:MAG: hypothetical protein HY392_03475, partial [Candidatus Diapherotrites archaeon]|nr:hypothetical protein [Candidatus Diapherotrites archaeon]
MPNPIALFAMTPEDECLGVMCNDFNPCTNNFCVNGECTFPPLQSGSSCGENKTCENNKCIETITVKRPTGLITPPVEPTQKTGYNPLIAIIAVAILLTGAIVFLAMRKKQA